MLKHCHRIRTANETMPPEMLDRVGVEIEYLGWLDFSPLGPSFRKLNLFPSQAKE
jgi:hypothetical protein